MEFTLLLSPPLCGCCGSPCPVSKEWRDDPHWSLDYLCVLCEASRAEPITGSRGHSVYRLWDGTEWVVHEGTWRDISVLFPSTDPLMAAAVGFWDAAGRSTPRSGPSGRGMVRCRNPHRHEPVRCGSRSSPDLADSRAWRHLTAELQNAGLLDVPRRLAVYRPTDTITGQMLDETCFITGTTESFTASHLKTAQLCVFRTHGAGCYLSWDVFDGEIRVKTPDKRDAAAALELREQWWDATSDPVLEGAACVALHTAYWRHDVDDLLRAHVWLSVALIEDPEVRTLGVGLARTGEHRQPSDLRAALADLTGDDAIRTDPPYGSPTDMLDPTTRNVRDVWLFEGGPYG